MTNQIANENYTALLGRLQKLERENQKMRRCGVAVLVATAALIFMGQTGKNRVLDADSLVIRDASGNIRVELGTSEDHSPVLRMWGGSDSKTASLLLNSNQKGSGLMFFGKGVTMLTNTDGPSLVLAGGASSGGGGGTSIDAGSVETYDNDKFGAIMGKMATVDDRTGNTTWSSAASLKLVRKDGKVIWQAP